MTFIILFIIQVLEVEHVAHLRIAQDPEELSTWVTALQFCPREDLAELAVQSVR